LTVLAEQLSEDVDGDAALKSSAKLVCGAAQSLSSSESDDKSEDTNTQNVLNEIEVQMKRVFSSVAVDDWRCMNMKTMALGAKYLEVKCHPFFSFTDH
jgi:hypothetical protein